MHIFKTFIFAGMCLAASSACGSEVEEKLRQELYERQQTQYVVIKVRDMAGFILLGTIVSYAATVLGLGVTVVCLPVGLIILVPASIASFLFSFSATAALPILSSTVLYAVYNWYQIAHLRDKLDAHLQCFAERYSSISQPELKSRCASIKGA